MSEVSDGRKGSRGILRSDEEAWGKVPLWLLQRDVQPAALRCYVVLSYHSRGKDEGVAFPSIEKMMQETNLSKASVKRGLRELKDAGAIEGEQRKRGKGSGGGYDTTIYTVRVNEPAPKDSQLSMEVDDDDEWEFEDTPRMGSDLVEDQEGTPIAVGKGSDLLNGKGSPATPKERRSLEETRSSVATQPSGATPPARRAPTPHQLAYGALEREFCRGGKPSRRLKGEMETNAKDLLLMEAQIEEVPAKAAELRLRGLTATPSLLVRLWWELGVPQVKRVNGARGSSTSPSEYIASAEADERGAHR